MSSAAINTMVKMMESLPKDKQAEMLNDKRKGDKWTEIIVKSA